MSQKEVSPTPVHVVARYRPDEGIKFPVVKTREGLTRALSMRVAAVKGPLLAVYDMMHKGQKVVFDLRGDGSFVENHDTGERVAIDWKGHDPIIKMWVLEPEAEDKSTPELCDFGSGGTIGVSSNPTASSSTSLPPSEGFLGPADLL